MANWADFAVSVKKAEAAARKALEMGPEFAETHAAMGYVHGAMDRHEEARLEFEKAIRINPNLAEANAGLGFFYGTFGRFDEAIRYHLKACSLDPLNPGPALNLVMVLRVTGKVDDALEVVARFEHVHPGNPWFYNQAAECYIQKKDFAKASEAIDVGLRFDPDNRWLKSKRGMLHALSGRKGEAMDELRALMKDEAESHRLQAQVWIRMALGDLDEAFEALMRQAELHSWYGLIKFDPLFEGLQKDPRFPEFCKKVGLPP
jgi:Flp pilus assembly protein TadD